MGHYSEHEQRKLDQESGAAMDRRAAHPPAEKVWVSCWQCGGAGEIEGDCTCMDDTCCCLEPEPPECGHCGGAGGYLVPADSQAARDAIDG